MRQFMIKLVLSCFCFALFFSNVAYSQFRFSQIKVQGNNNTGVETIKSISGLKKNKSLSIFGCVITRLFFNYYV